MPHMNLQTRDLIANREIAAITAAIESDQHSLVGGRFQLPFGVSANQKRYGTRQLKPKMPVIGMQVGVCVAAVITGQVTEDRIVHIVSNGKSKDFEKQLTDLERGQWSEMSQTKRIEAKAIAHRLFKAGKILFPQDNDPAYKHAPFLPWVYAQTH